MYTICILFLVLSAGILAGIYAGMSLAVKLSAPKTGSKHKEKGPPRGKWNKHAEQERKGSMSKRKDIQQEPAVPEEDSMDVSPPDGDDTRGPEEFSEPDMEHEPESSPELDTKDEPEDFQDPEMEDEDFPEMEQDETLPEMEQENDKHSYMEFVCESIGQDAVSRIRAARKTQDNKYMNRMKKKKLTEEKE